MVTDSEIHDIAKKIRKRSGPSDIYLFGSYAYGVPTEDSDIDFMVVKPVVHNRRQELIDMKRDIISKDYSIDIILLGQKELAQKSEEGWSVILDIMAKGIRLNVE